MAKEKFFEEENEWWNSSESSEGRDKDADANETESAVKDCNGTPLNAGDTVTIIKGLKVKGGKDIKQGTTVKNIRLTNDDGAIEGKVEGSVIVIKTEFVRKN